MSTHAFIGLEKRDGSVSFIYVHYDGFPRNMAPMLTQNWAELARVKKLLSKGDLLGVKATLRQCHRIGTPPFKDKPQHADTVEDFTTIARGLGGSYAYLFRASGWEMFDADTKMWVPASARLQG